MTTQAHPRFSPRIGVRPVRAWIARELRRHALLYLMILPGVLYFLIFRYVPMYGAIIAFKDYRVLEGFTGSPWVGLKHFRTIFSSPFFYNVLTNTILISTYKLVFGTPAAIILALLLNEVRISWFKRSVQTITYLPHFLSWVVVFGILLVTLSPSSGLLNKAIVALGGQPINFLADPDWFRTVLVASDIWKELGWGTIIYLAAMAGISPSLYEAAIVDGATRLQRMRYITLPGILPVIVLVTLLRIGNLLSAGFEQVFVLYNPSVYSVADIIDTWVYRQGIQGFQFSLAAAVGLFKGAVGAVLLISAHLISKRTVGVGLW
ncbi:ABC transporter permease [Kallotenue papyrolyticum]|uniref:ABC transporter permease n=1 Tax=Kallotenue papyrolyticum TaxID=1325125 RepID=UPI000470F1FF|nr:sugar ABC transporter permease [Kallotenue papyrolyticum]